jgi:hypothetical protein
MAAEESNGSEAAHCLFALCTVTHVSSAIERLTAIPSTKQAAFLSDYEYLVLSLASMGEQRPHGYRPLVLQPARQQRLDPSDPEHALFISTQNHLQSQHIEAIRWDLSAALVRACVRGWGWG